MDDILWNTEQKKVVILVCIDLSAAFNMVDHSVLIKVLNNYYGISGSGLQWFELYLGKRSMKVSLGDVLPETKRLSFLLLKAIVVVLLPQWFPKSSLSQLIWMHSQMIIQFQITSTLQLGNSKLNAVMKLSSCPDNVGSWMDSSRLNMNAKKTEVIYIGSRNQLDKCENKEICVRNNLIPWSPLIKYLGACINEPLTFQHHINMKCKQQFGTFWKLNIWGDI